jgi:hypothetical protein
MNVNSIILFQKGLRMEIILSKGVEDRLKRIQELKKYSEKNAIEYAISVAWLVTEKDAAKGFPLKRSL